MLHSHARGESLPCGRPGLLLQMKTKACASDLEVRQVRPTLPRFPNKNLCSLPPKVCNTHVTLNDGDGLNFSEKSMERMLPGAVLCIVVLSLICLEEAFAEEQKVSQVS